MYMSLLYIGALKYRTTGQLNENKRHYIIVQYFLVLVVQFTEQLTKHIFISLLHSCYHAVE